MRMDLTVTDYPDRAALDRYMYGSAEVIGLQLLPVLGTVVPREEAARTRQRSERRSSSPTSGIRNVNIENVQATEALVPSSITGLPEMEVRDVTLSNLRLQNAIPGRPDWAKRPVPEKETAYPESRMFGMLPASGLYVRHVRDLRLNDVSFTAAAGEGRPTLIFDDVIGARLSQIQSSPVSGGMPVILQSNSRDVQILKQAG